MVGGINPFSHEDVALVVRLKEGDQVAFEACYHKYHAALYRFALKFLRSSMLAEEMVQDTFLKVWENCRDLDPAQSFKSYLYTITRNNVLNVLSRSSREATIHQEIVRHFQVADNNTENEIIYNDYQQIVNDAISQLPPQRQLVFRLCRLEGKSYHEVATLLNISPGTVSDHMVKAGKTLKDFLSQHAGMSFRTIPFILAASALG